MSKILVAVALFLGILIGSFSNSIVTNVFSQVVTGNNIHGCINDTTGAVRIVPNNTNCNSGETLETWRKLEKGEGNFPFVCYGCGFNDVAPIGNLFKNRDYTGAYMINTSFSSVVGSADISGVNFNKASLSETVFDGTLMDNASIKNAFATGLRFSNVSTSAQNVNFTSSNLESLSTSGSTGTNFTGSNFSSTNLTSAIFRDAIMQNTNFNNSNLTSATFDNTDLTGATNMSTATRTGVTWSNSTCPDGTNSDTNGGTCEGHL